MGLHMGLSLEPNIAPVRLLIVNVFGVGTSRGEIGGVTERRRSAPQDAFAVC